MTIDRYIVMRYSILNFNGNFKMKFTSIDDVVENGKFADVVDFVYPNFDANGHNIKRELGRQLSSAHKHGRALTIKYEAFHCPDCNECVEVIQEGANIVIENKDIKCFERRDYEYTINSLSGKIVIANKLHKYTNVGDYINEYDLNSLKEVEEMTGAYAAENFFIGYVGNTTIKADDTNGLTIREPSDEEYESDSNHNFISCSLWWIMATAIENIRMDELEAAQEDYIIVDLEPNRNYSFKTDFRKPFYEFVKNG